MIDHPEYTLSPPPNCPIKWDHLSIRRRGDRKQSSRGFGSIVDAWRGPKRGLRCLDGVP